MEFYSTHEFIQDFIKLIKQCNDIILKIYYDQFNIIIKTDQTPLTIADIEINNKICKYLMEINKKINIDILIISEENKNKSYEERKKYEWCWLVDPIDGTKEFIQKNGQFTVNIGLVHFGIPVFGIVSVPVTGEIYYGAKDLGSFKLSKDKLSKLIVNKNEITKIKIVISNSHINDETYKYIEQFDSYELIRLGSSLKILWISENKADIYPRIGYTSEWDTCASHAVLKYAGGKMIQYDNGEELSYNKEYLLNPYFIAKDK